jgi:hypothetical protein
LFEGTGCSQGKSEVVPAAEITLDQIGNDSTATISLTKVLIFSIRFIASGEIPEVEITLAAATVTIQ